MVVRNLMFLEVENRLKDQEAFFESLRPFQPVLMPSAPGTDVEHWRDELIGFWRASGWPSIQSEEQ